MPANTFPRDISFDFRDPMQDTYHVEGADVPEAMEGRKRIKRTKRTNPLDSAK